MMGLFKVEKGIPLPPDTTLNRQFYPWQEMEAGDSFFAPGKKVTAMSAKASWAGRQYGKQFICRTVKGGIRVWCVGNREAKKPRGRAAARAKEIESYTSDRVFDGVRKMPEEAASRHTQRVKAALAQETPNDPA